MILDRTTLRPWRVMLNEASVQWPGVDRVGMHLTWLRAVGRLACAFTIIFMVSLAAGVLSHHRLTEGDFQTTLLFLSVELTLQLICGLVIGQRLQHDRERPLRPPNNDHETLLFQVLGRLAPYADPEAVAELCTHVSGGWWVRGALGDRTVMIDVVPDPHVPGVWTVRAHVGAVLGEPSQRSLMLGAQTVAVESSELLGQPSLAFTMHGSIGHLHAWLPDAVSGLVELAAVPPAGVSRTLPVSPLVRAASWGRVSGAVQDDWSGQRRQALLERVAVKSPEGTLDEGMWPAHVDRLARHPLVTLGVAVGGLGALWGALGASASSMVPCVVFGSAWAATMLGVGGLARLELARPPRRKPRVLTSGDAILERRGTLLKVLGGVEQIDLDQPYAVQLSRSPDAGVLNVALTQHPSGQPPHRLQFRVPVMPHASLAELPELATAWPVLSGRAFTAWVWPTVRQHAELHGQELPWGELGVPRQEHHPVPKRSVAQVEAVA